MRVPSATNLLAAVERGQQDCAPARALSLLAAALPHATSDVLAGLTVGNRDGRLLELHELLFGPTLDAATECLACHAPLDVSAPTAALRDASAEPGRDEALACDGWDVRFRLPTSVDLIALAGETEVERARRALLDRCVASVHHDGVPTAVESLPADVVAKLGARMGEVDPQGWIRLAIACPTCGHEWDEDLDVAAFVWAEAQAWAHHIARDVHALASAYGWTERDVLGMSAWRRGLYLDLVGA